MCILHLQDVWIWTSYVQSALEAHVASRSHVGQHTFTSLPTFSITNFFPFADWVSLKWYFCVALKCISSLMSLRSLHEFSSHFREVPVTALLFFLLEVCLLGLICRSSSHILDNSSLSVTCKCFLLFRDFTFQTLNDVCWHRKFLHFNVALSDFPCGLFFVHEEKAEAVKTVFCFYAKGSKVLSPICMLVNFSRLYFL